MASHHDIDEDDDGNNDDCLCVCVCLCIIMQLMRARRDKDKALRLIIQLIGKASKPFHWAVLCYGKWICLSLVDLFAS